MTSPSTYRCTACGREFGSTSPAVVFGVHGVGPRSRLTCTSGSLVPVTVDITRDDRAGVTLPTAIQPVGGDQLVPVGAGDGLGQADAGGHEVAGRGHQDSIATASSSRTANRCAADSHAFARGRR